MTNNIIPMPKRGWNRADADEWSVQIPRWINFLFNAK